MSRLALFCGDRANRPYERAEPTHRVSRDIRRQGSDGLVGLKLHSAGPLKGEKKEVNLKQQRVEFIKH